MEAVRNRERERRMDRIRADIMATKCDLGDLIRHCNKAGNRKQAKAAWERLDRLYNALATASVGICSYEETS